MAWRLSWFTWRLSILTINDDFSVSIYFSDFDPNDSFSYYRGGNTSSGVRDWKQRAMRYVRGRSVLYAGLERLGVSNLSSVTEGMSPSGKPFFRCPSDFQFSISHSDSVSLCAISRHNIGIDLESKISGGQLLVRRFFSSSDQEFLKRFDCENYDLMVTKLWTIKESYLKFRGVGIGSIREAIKISFLDSLRLEIGTIDNIPFYSAMFGQRSFVTICSDSLGATGSLPRITKINSQLVFEKLSPKFLCDFFYREEGVYAT